MKAEKRKSAILKSSKRLFSAHGFHRTQISDIIKEVRVARGTIYQYFANKQEIFITLLENAYEQWEREISLAIQEIDLKTIQPEEYFRLRIKTTLAFLVADPDICKIIMSMGFGLPTELARATRQLEKKIRTIAANDFQLGQHNHHVRESLNPKHTGEMIAGALFRSVHYALSQVERNGQAVDVEALTDEIVALFAPGIFKTELLQNR